MSYVLGLDIGGNNVKAAHVERGTELLAGRTACLPMIDRPTLVTTLVDMDLAPELVVATETLSASREFARTREDGVSLVADVLAKVFGEDRVRFLGHDYGLHSIAEAAGNAKSISCRNWAATAYLGWRFAPAPDGLLIDLGTTSTDVVPVVDGRPRLLDGAEDVFHTRLATGELVWSGVMHTPVVSFVRRVSVGGRETRVKSSCRALTGDAYLVAGMLAEEDFPLMLSHEGPVYRLWDGARTLEVSRMQLRDLVARGETSDEIELADDLARQIVRAQLGEVRGAVEAVREAAERKWNVRLDTAQLAGLGAGILRDALHDRFREVHVVRERAGALLAEGFDFSANTETALGCAVRALRELEDG